MLFIICDFALLIFGNVLMNFFFNKLNLDKPPIIKKYCCHKVPNKKNIVLH